MPISASLPSSRPRLPSYFALPRGASLGNHVQLLRNGDAAYAEMLRAIDAAESTIHLEIYIFRSDTIGWTFARRLAARAEKGVEVNMIYDAFGSFGTDGGLFRFLEETGVRLLRYHPLLPWRRPKGSESWSWQKRDHRKMLIVDGRIGFTGGLNIGDEYTGREGWRDFFIRIEGPAVREMQRLFWATWHRHGGEPMDPERSFPRLPLEGRSGPANREDHQEPSEAGTTLTGGMLVQVLGNRELKNRFLIRRAFLKAVRSAKQRIYIAHAYFVPDRGIRRALRNAARRGVEVIVLLPSVSDVPPLHYACRALYARFLCCGIRIFEWPLPILHSKMTVIDGVWSSVGSYNIDHRSLFHNLEVIVNIYDEGFGRELQEMFKDDLGSSQEIHLADWERRPYRHRLLEQFFYFFRYWL